MNVAIRTRHLTKVYAGRVIAVNDLTLEECSLFSLSQAMPTVLRTPWNRNAGQTNGSHEAVLQSALQWWGSVSGVLATGATPAAEPKGSFFERGSYEDFSLLRVLLGYGLPALGAFGLSVLAFSWRDL